MSEAQTPWQGTRHLASTNISIQKVVVHMEDRSEGSKREENYFSWDYSIEKFLDKII